MKDKAWYVEQHRAMWNWIADRIESRQKFQYIPRLKRKWCEVHGCSPKNHCFACEYKERLGGFCHGMCLFDWGTEYFFTGCMEGYYGKCINAETWQEQAELARLIANLPVREEV